MENFNNPPVIWMIAGFIFFLLEFAIPGFILFFFAVGAWIVALLCLFFDMSVSTQLVTFLLGSVVTILLFRNWVKKNLWVKNSASEIENEFIGKTGKAASRISPGNDGKVDFKGTSWQAKSDDIIEEGELVTIVGNESIRLIVKSTNSLL